MIFASVAAQYTRSVDFVYVSDKAYTKVSVAGTFNGWNKDANPMVLQGSTWMATLQLAPGKHLYKFVLDGEDWITDPRAAKTEDDNDGHTNSVILVSPVEFLKPAIKGDGTITEVAVVHKQEFPFVNWDRGVTKIRLATRTNDVQKISVVFKTASGKRSLEMSPIIEDDFISTFESNVPWDRKGTLTYSFVLDDGKQPQIYDQLGLRGSMPSVNTGVEKDFVLDSKTFKPLVPPSWVEKSIIYQIFPDRFANGDKSNDPGDVVAWDGKPTYSNFLGGDFAGVKQHLPHIKSLGVNCIYFNPIFEGPSNHRYEARDYKKIDHRLGTNSEFTILTEQMEKQGVRTVLDGVFNHTAVNFFAFADILKRQQESKYLNWYAVKSFPVSVTYPPPYEAWAGFESMPKLNTANQDVRDYLLSIPEFWNKTAKISGWRLDAAEQVPSDYWKLFHDKVKGEGNDKWIVGEIWTDATPWLKGDQFDSVMNYRFREAVLGFVAKGKTNPKAFLGSLMRTYNEYGPQVSRNMMNIIGSHDTPRILNECGQDIRLARLAAMIQFTWIGAPSVYYGDELGMAGGKDPDNRRGMEWQTATSDNQTLKLYRELAKLRLSSNALQSGDVDLARAENEDGLLTFRRKVGNDSAIVVVNRANKKQGIRWNNLTLSGSKKVVADVFENTEHSTAVRRVELEAKNDSVEVDVPALSIAVLQPKSAENAHISSLNHIKQKALVTPIGEQS